MASTEPVSFSRAAAEQLVEQFEAGTISLAEFHHRQHLAVAAWLLIHHAPVRALARMRRGLQALLQRSGKTEGYHETVTVFWMRVLSARLEECPAEWTPEARLNDAVAWAEESCPLQEHYSPERLAAPEAKQQFVEPDRRPLTPVQ